MDEGTKAIIREISREIVDNHTEKWENTAKENNVYLKSKFECLESKINKVKEVVDGIKSDGCKLCADHVKEHEEKGKRMITTVTIISAVVPTLVLVFNWAKSVIISWIQKPGNFGL